MAEAVKPSTQARDALYRRFASLVTVNSDLDRSLVSFQANYSLPFYSWFKYKEGFSASIVNYLLSKLDQPAGVLLDPFAGVGTAIFASVAAGWRAVGIEVLPVGLYVMQARMASQRVDAGRFAAFVHRILSMNFADHYDDMFAFPHIPITRGAFPPETERDMAGYLALCHKECEEPDMIRLLRSACLAVLESVSFTRKDGQYLRWDHRSGRIRGKKLFDKGPILPFRKAITDKLIQMIADLNKMPRNGQMLLFPSADIEKLNDEHVQILEGSCLDTLPRQQQDSIDLVITSPPYCNRYDYTRTYALELAFLGCDDRQVKQIRQTMLSTTVENRQKRDQLQEMYKRLGADSAFHRVNQVFAEQQALHEVLNILDLYRKSGMLNNDNVPRMVRNYFYEMCFVVCELARILRKGGHIAMINDNVQYAGEEVPVDLILSSFAESFGLTTKQIWTLPRGKGNSSQQMGNHGRSELRKCVYIWEKRDG